MNHQCDSLYKVKKSYVNIMLTIPVNGKSHDHLMSTNISYFQYAPVSQNPKLLLAMATIICKYL